MRKMSKRLKLVSIALLSLLMVGVAYGLIKYIQTVSNTATIKGYGITLWRTDTSAAVTTIAWGDLVIGESKNTETVLAFTEKLKVKNTGNIVCYWGWKVDPATPLPTGVTLTCEAIISSVWIDIPSNAFNLTPNGPMNAGALNQYPIRWTLAASDAAAMASINFNILILCATTSEG